MIKCIPEPKSLLLWLSSQRSGLLWSSFMILNTAAPHSPSLQWRMTGLVYVDMKVIYDSLSVNLFPLRFSFRSWMGKGRKYETSHLRVSCVWVHILNVHINFSPYYSAGTMTTELCLCVPGLAKTPCFQVFIYLAELGLSCIMRDVVVLGGTGLSLWAQNCGVWA